MDYLGKLLRVMETLEVHLRGDKDPVEIERDKTERAARERVKKEIFPLLDESQRNVVESAFAAIEDLYEYLLLRGKSLAFSLGIALGTEAIAAAEEFFCWE